MPKTPVVRKFEGATALRIHIGLVLCSSTYEARAKVRPGYTETTGSKPRFEPSSLLSPANTREVCACARAKFSEDVFWCDARINAT